MKYENDEGIGWDEILHEFPDSIFEPDPKDVDADFERDQWLREKEAEEQIAQAAEEAGDDGVVIVFPKYVDDSCPQCGCEGPWKTDSYVHERGCGIKTSLENGSKW